MTDLKTPSVQNPHTTRLRRWRQANGLTLVEVGGLTGLSHPYLSRLERGERQLAPLDRVRFARLVGAPVADLFEPAASPIEDDSE